MLWSISTKKDIELHFFPPMAPDVHEDPSKLFFSEDQCSSFPRWHQHIAYTGDPPHGRSVDLGARYLKSHLGVQQLESTSKKCCKSKHGCFNSLVPLAFGIWNYMSDMYFWTKTNMQPKKVTCLSVSQRSVAGSMFVFRGRVKDVNSIKAVISRYCRESSSISWN